METGVMQERLRFREDSFDYNINQAIKNYVHGAESLDDILPIDEDTLRDAIMQRVYEWCDVKERVQEVFDAMQARSNT
jgi:hypothetical protein